MASRPTPEPPLAVRDIEAGTVLETNRFKVTSMETKHLPDPSVKSLGYRVESDYGSVAISGDTAISDGMGRWPGTWTFSCTSASSRTSG